MPGIPAAAASLLRPPAATRTARRSATAAESRRTSRPPPSETSARPCGVSPSPAVGEGAAGEEGMRRGRCGAERMWDEESVGRARCEASEAWGEEGVRQDTHEHAERMDGHRHNAWIGTEGGVVIHPHCWTAVRSSLGGSDCKPHGGSVRASARRDVLPWSPIAWTALYRRMHEACMTHA
eukprot:256876-Chlamydomonas_euryale.AAC.1